MRAQSLHFIEGCSAPKYNVANLHAGCVELFVGKNAKLRYSTIENWSKNMYNLNTKRAIVEEGGTIEWVSGSFGSHVSYLYPMTYPEGKRFPDGIYRYHFCGKGPEPGYRSKGGSQRHRRPLPILIRNLFPRTAVSAPSEAAVVITKKAPKSKAAVSCQSLMLDDISTVRYDPGHGYPYEAMPTWDMRQRSARSVMMRSFI